MPRLARLATMWVRDGAFYGGIPSLMVGLMRLGSSRQFNSSSGMMVIVTAWVTAFLFSAGGV